MLHNHKQLFVSLNYLVKLDDVEVANFLEDFDLTSDALDVFLIIDFFFLQDFYSNFFSSQNVGALLHLAEGTFTECLAEDVVAYSNVAVSVGTCFR